MLKGKGAEMKPNTGATQVQSHEQEGKDSAETGSGAKERHWSGCQLMRESPGPDHKRELVQGVSE